METLAPTQEPLLDRHGLAAPKSDYYADLTARNNGLISPADQARLRRSEILVAGCGSIGGAVVAPLIRLGAECLSWAEPDHYELHNLNRQQAGLADIGRNKAEVLAEWAAGVNPRARVRVETAGITAGNVRELVSRAALIFDGVDVTAQPALVCKYLLHEEAKRARVPVVSGYDIAGVQLVMVYDYRGRMPVLGGRIDAAGLAGRDPMRFLARVVPLRALPLEIFPALRRLLIAPGAPFPQLGYSAQMFGALAPRLALDLLAGRPVRRRILVDINNLPRTRRERSRVRVARAVELARMASTARSYRR